MINGQETRDELLTQKQRLLGEIDKLHTEAFTRDGQLRQMKEIIEETRHTQQLAGWAIDRALETIKLAPLIDPKDFAGEAKGLGYANTMGTHVICLAEKFCSWVKSSSAPEVKPSADAETMQ